MTVENLLFFAKKHIHSDHAKILIAELLDCNPLELLNHLEENVPLDKVEMLKKEIEAIENNKPLQYVLGNVNFYGNKFYIDNRVLIPRFETEELVENTIKYINQFFTKPVDIIDLGCGSGVIGITLAKKISTNSVDLVDISKEALEVAHMNCGNLNIQANIIQSDMFSAVDKKYDVIISNPPYIKIGEEIESIVRENEPHLALYAGADGLDCYRKIFNNIKEHMQEKCLIALEIGMTQAKEIETIVKKTIPGSKIKVKKDLSGKDRMIFVFVGLME